MIRYLRCLLFRPAPGISWVLLLLFLFLGHTRVLSVEIHDIDSDRSTQTAIEKYSLLDPGNWGKATDHALALKAQADKMIRDGETKAQMPDSRSRIDGTYKDRSQVRREGQTIIEKANELYAESALIGKAIQAVKDYYRNIPKEAALTDYRKWVSNDGSVSIDGRIVVEAGNHYILQRSDDEIYSITLEMLSADDQQYINDQRFLLSSRLTPNEYERKQLVDAYQQAGSSNEIAWSFKNTDLTIEGRVVKDEGNSIVLGSTDGAFYRIPVVEFDDSTRAHLDRRRFWASIRLNNVSNRLRELSRSPSHSPSREWKIPDLSISISGMLLDVAGDSIIILGNQDEFFSVPLNMLSTEDQKYANHQRVLVISRLTPNEYERKQLVDAYQQAGSSNEIAWSFKNTDLTIEGRVVKDEGNSIVLGSTDGAFYRIPVIEFDDSMREKLNMDRFWVSIKLQNVNYRLRELERMSDATPSREWSIPERKTSVSGRLLDVSGDSIFILGAADEFFVIPVLMLSADDQQYINDQRFLLSSRLTPNEYERKQLVDAYQQAGSSNEIAWSFKNTDLTIEGRVVKDEGNSIVLGSTDGAFYRIPVIEFNDSMREKLNTSRALARLIPVTEVFCWREGADPASEGSLLYFDEEDVYIRMNDRVTTIPRSSISGFAKSRLEEWSPASLNQARQDADSSDLVVISFRVRDALDYHDFLGAYFRDTNPPLGGGLYDIEFMNGGRALLFTTHTLYATTGWADLFVYKIKDYGVTYISGFKETIPVLCEVSDQKRFSEQQKVERLNKLLSCVDIMSKNKQYLMTDGYIKR